VADAFGMEVAAPQPMSLVRQMPSLAGDWAGLATRHNLRGPAFDKLVSWGFGDFIFNCEFDVVSDMGKIRRAGFVEPSDNALWIDTALSQLRDKKIIP
jgi:hypothetical protein